MTQRANLQTDSSTKSVQAQLDSVDSDISGEEALETIEIIMSGFCSFLSAIPSDAWVNRKFEERDLFTSDSADVIDGRFLPVLCGVIDLEAG